ncbi:hypothetical protein [Angustibacter luteus]|uniref:NfeD-like C-terminal domain-containing protein n=1 Tax=Angustibacter luteus TaxID=658456 RepID=A0ABW1JE55_9ACTN
MLVFLIVGAAGLVLLLGSLLLDGVLDSVLPSFDLPGGDVISGPALGAFVTAFGAMGAIVSSAGAGTGVACLAGLGAGLLLGALVAVVTRSMVRTATDATPRSLDLVGLTGTVVTAIPADGLGEISVRLAGAPHKLNARSAAAVLAGTTVEVTEVLSSTSVRVTARA